jgi:hypothetical protein
VGIGESIKVRCSPTLSFGMINVRCSLTLIFRIIPDDRFQAPFGNSISDQSWENAASSSG